MAQRPDSGVPVKPARGFPWRLWLYASLITGAAGAAGYFAWQYRQQALHGEDAHADCTKNLTAVRTQAAEATKQATGLEQQSGEVAKNLNATKDELTQLRAQKAEADKRMAAIEDIQKQFAKMIDTGQLQVVARHGALVVSLPSEVLFPSGSSDLDDGVLAL